MSSRVSLRRLAAALLTVALFAGIPAVSAAPKARRATCTIKASAADRARLRSVTRQRPRVLADAAVLARARRLSETHATPARWREQLHQSADRAAASRPQQYARVGGRLQFSSYKNRLLVLALAWRMDGDRAHLAAAEREMLRVAGWRDWNPAHYLDTAEITAVTAVGYDWLYDDLSRATRRTIRAAIVNKGLKTSLCRYRQGRGGLTSRSNWGIVTNAGMAMGALAVSDTNPRVAAAVLGAAVRNVRPAMRAFGPDGSYPEGPAYWRYATEHATKLLASLDASLGTQLGIATIGGFPKTGQFALFSVGPTGKAANFGDADESLGRVPQLFWLARRFKRPADGWLRLQQVGEAPTPLDLLWFTPRTADPGTARVRRSFVAAGSRSVFLRSRWNDPDAAYVAARGGSNRVPHAQPELGAFVFDSQGHRWALDLGRDDYNLPSYFNWSRRKDYYRTATRGQNTLQIGGGNQLRGGRATVTHFRAKGPTPQAVLDLSSAYERAVSVRRGLALVDRTSLLVQDEIVTRRRQPVIWSMHTDATVTLGVDRQSAVLWHGTERITARILAPGAGRAWFAVRNAEQAPPQARNAGVSRLVVHTTTKRARPESRPRVRLAVHLSHDPLPLTSPPVRPLKTW